MWIFTDQIYFLQYSMFLNINSLTWVNTNNSEQMKTKGYAAIEAGGQLKEFEYDLGPIGDHQVDVKVETCGLCYSDVSMIDDQWGMTTFPFVPGHEIIGTVEAVGSHVKHLHMGQRVGVGWESGSCGTCES
jgi:uncharacterized zinc-type alcohol dehydrogenase-like protein